MKINVLTMKKLLEISNPFDCIHRKPSFVSYHPLTGERDGHSHVEGYYCAHPEITPEFLKHHHLDFQPCNNEKRFPKRCPLKTAPIEVPKSNIFISPEVLEKIEKTVDIYAPKGTAVRLQMKGGEVFGGYESDKAQAMKYLKFSEVYHVASTDVGGWHTDVYLEEFPGIGFNSVMFEHVEE